MLLLNSVNDAVDLLLSMEDLYPDQTDELIKVLQSIDIENSDSDALSGFIGNCRHDLGVEYNQVWNRTFDRITQRCKDSGWDEEDIQEMIDWPRLPM